MSTRRIRPKSLHDPRLLELMKIFLKIAKRVKKPYAVGGAIAMSGHGYTRNTFDLDVFLKHEDQRAWLFAARKEGLVVDSLFRAVHYIGFLPKHGDPRIRIDFLFPAEETDRAAIRKPVLLKVDGFVMRAFRVELLALNKFLSERPKDRHDFLSMLELGLFEPKTVGVLLQAVEPDRYREYRQVVKA